MNLNKKEEEEKKQGSRCPDGHRPQLCHLHGDGRCNIGSVGRAPMTGTNVRCLSSTVETEKVRRPGECESGSLWAFGVRFSTPRDLYHLFMSKASKLDRWGDDDL
jgi:hypothetical protein